MFFKIIRCFFLITGLLVPAVHAQTLHLNELMSSNHSTFTDDDGDYVNWIEILHAGPEPYSLKGYGLSDDPEQPFRWVFPDTTLLPGEFLLVWASGKDRNVPGRDLHTNFGVSYAGERVLLTRPDSIVVDSIPPVWLPPDVSLGRKPDGTGPWHYFIAPTPGVENFTRGFAEMLEAPLFSHTPGFYEHPFDLTISHPDTSVTLYFTLDGSEPDTTSAIAGKPLHLENRSHQPNVLSMIPTNAIVSGPQRWREPAGTVNKAHVIRVLAVKEGALSRSTTGSFFILDQGTEAYSLPVWSLVTDSLHLFDHHNGIYVPGVHYRNDDPGTGNYYQRGEDWERPAHLEFFEADGSLGFNQPAGVRIHGGWSRRYPMKSLRLYSRRQYGPSGFYYPVFPESDHEDYNRLILRNSGNDFSASMMMDAAAQSLVRHFNMDTQRYRPSIMFINGEYWGIHNIRERYDEHYLQRVYGADPDRIDLLTGRNSIKAGSNSHYNAMLSFMRNNDLSEEVNYQHLQTLMDIDNFMDYYSAQIYYGNSDWPHNNIDFWRYRTDYNPHAPPGLDGRWRWMLYDADRSLGLATGPEFDMVEWATLPLNPRFNAEWPNFLLRSLLKNPDFKRDFIHRLTDHLNSAFAPHRVASVIDSLRQAILPEIDEHIQRWPNHGNRSYWDGWVSLMYDYAEDRPAWQRAHMSEHFDLGDPVTISLNLEDTQKGYLSINSLDLTADTPGVAAPRTGSHPVYPWKGIYFSGHPVTLTAHPKSGHVFSHWSSSPGWSSGQDTTSSQITFYPVDDATYTAHFISEPDDEEPVKRQIIHYWVFTDALPNNTPLDTIYAAYSDSMAICPDSEATSANPITTYLRYQPAVTPYPPLEGTEGIMDRVNDPVSLNYLPEHHGERVFEESQMRGLRLRNPSLVEDRESALILHLPTRGFENTEFRFAARRTTSGQQGIILEYLKRRPSDPENGNGNNGGNGDDSANGNGNGNNGGNDDDANGNGNNNNDGNDDDANGNGNNNNDGNGDDSANGNGNGDDDGNDDDANGNGNNNNDGNGDDNANGNGNGNDDGDGDLSNEDKWVVIDHPHQEFTLHEDWQEYSLTLDHLSAARDNPDFALRIRFAGDTEIRSGNSGNVRLNNISLSGFPLSDTEDPDDSDDCEDPDDSDDPDWPDIEIPVPFTFRQTTDIYTQNFNHYRGDQATLPMHWAVDWNRELLENPFTGTCLFDLAAIPSDSTCGNFTAWTADGQDFSFGIREKHPGDLQDARLYFHFKNETEEPIRLFEIQYDVEAWHIGDRRNRIRLKYDTTLAISGRSTFETDLIQTTNPSPEITPGTLVDGSKSMHRVRVSNRIDLTRIDDGTGEVFDVLQHGDSAWFRWQFSNAQGDSGTYRSGLALNNVTISIPSETTSSIYDEKMAVDLPADYALRQNHPNPFNPVTRIRYELPQASEVTLEIFDLLGRHIATLVNGQQSAGYHHVEWDASRISSGIYLSRLNATSLQGNKNFQQTRKMTVLK